MSTKFLSLTGLEQYNDLIKEYVDTGLAGKSGSTHTHDDRYYTESEIDTKLSTINTNVDKIVSGATTVAYATKAGSANSASKLGSETVGSATKPIYLNAGVATTCTTYAGGTKLTVNGSNKGGSSAAIFAPTTGGTAGQVLKSAGTASAPVWETLDVYNKTEIDTKLSGKSDTSHNHDDKYDAKGASTAALDSAKTYTDTKTVTVAKA